MSLALPAPVINGFFSEWNRLEFGVGGLGPLQNLGVRACDFSTKINRQRIYAGQPIQQGRTRGIGESTGMMEVLKDHVPYFLQQMQSTFSQGGILGWAEWTWDFTVQWYDYVPTLHNNHLVSCCFAGEKNSHKQSADGLAEQLDFDYFYDSLDGITAFGGLAP